MNSFFHLKKKALRRYFFHLPGGLQRYVCHLNYKKIPIANFYISGKIKNEKITYQKELNLRCEHLEKVI